MNKPKAKLTLENAFDSIAVYQSGRQRFLPNDFLFETHYGERDVINALGTIVLKNVDVTGKRRTPYRGIVEAVDGSGLIGCQTFSFRVLRTGSQ